MAKVKEIEEKAKAIHAEFPTNWTYHAPEHFEQLYYLFTELLQHISHLEERVKELETVDTRHGIKLVDRLEQAEKRVKELESHIPHNFVRKEMFDQMAERVKELREGIEKHKYTKWFSHYVDGKPQFHRIDLANEDEELYKLIEGD